MAASVSPPPPLFAQRYRLEHRIAQGGMAEVWLATDQLLDRQVAVKFLKAALASDPVVAERFRREAIAVARLSHPNIVSVYDTVDEGGRQAVVMQYVPGRSLRQILDDEQRLSPEFTIRIGISISAALAAAHQAGLVHRDIKPGNILVTPEGRALLTDFGIAKATSGGGDLTSDNVMMGTAKYLSPEQVRGRRLDGRADLYALGLVLYECLAGRVPFQGGSDAETALARLQRDPTSLARLRPTLPEGLVELIHRLLAKDADDRPASGSVVQSALSRCLQQSANRPTTPARGTGVVRGPSTPPRGNQTPPPGRAVRPVQHRDPTPSVGARVPGRPARQFQQRRLPSLLVVGAILVVAIVVIAVLASSGGDPAAAPDTTVAPSIETTIVPTTLPGPVVVLEDGWSSSDPDGDDSVENEELIGLVHDGSGATSWATLCYANEFLGGKRGVGVVLALSAPATGSLQVSFGALPWSAAVYGAATLPTTFEGWGAPLSEGFSADRTDATFTLGSTPHQFLLVAFEQLAPDDGCTSANPYRGRISEIVLQAAP